MLEETFTLNNSVVACSSNHAAAVGIHGHLYVWGSSLGTYNMSQSSDSDSSSSFKEYSEFCEKLGFSDLNYTIKKPAYYSLHHPIYDVKVVQVACGENFTAVVAVEKKSKSNESIYFSKEIVGFNIESSIVSQQVPPEIYPKILISNKILKDLEDYLYEKSLYFIELFKSKIIKLNSFIHIMQNIVKSSLTESEIKEFVAYKEMRLPGDSVTLKPLYELFVKCYQNKGVLYVLGRPDEILPSHNKLKEYYTINKSTLVYHLIDLPESVSVGKIACGKNFVLMLSHSGHVFSWGTEPIPALGKNRSGSFKTIRPIHELNVGGMKILDITCGTSHCLALNVSGIIYAWGEGFLGQLGNSRRDNIFKPDPVQTDDTDVLYVKAGSNSSFCKTKSNNCFAWGELTCNKFGMISYQTSDKPFPFNFAFDVVDVGIGKTRCAYVAASGNLYISSPDSADLTNLNRKYKNLEGVQFYQVTANEENFFAVSTRGSIYSWSYENEEVTGRPDEKSIPLEISYCSQHFMPKDLEEFLDNDKINFEPSRQIKKVFCAEENTFLVTDKGEVIASGSNELGQLGIVHGDLDDFEGDCLSTFKYIPRLSHIFKVKLLSISCGDYHILAITDEFNALSWGSNEFGQLGRGYFSKSEKQPEKIPALKDLKIAQMSAGKNHSIALDSEGQVFVFGSSEKGKLGLGRINNSIEFASPKKISVLSRIRSVSAGSDHSAAVNKENLLFVWGYGWNGQLGLGNKDNLYEPFQLLTNIEWKEVSCGLTHTLGLSTEGIAYYWGEVNLQIEESQLLVPTKIIGLEEIRIKKVLASDRYSAAITEIGTAVYFWGKQEYKKIIGDTEDESDCKKIVAFPVPLNEKVADLSLGKYHVCLVTDQGKVYTWGYGYNGRIGQRFEGIDKAFDYKPIDLSSFFNLAEDEMVSQDLQKLLNEEEEMSKESNLLEVDKQIMMKIGECIEMFVEITEKDRAQDLFFMKCEHKQLSRLQQKPFDCKLIVNNNWSQDIVDRIESWGALLTVYQVHCCYLFNLLNTNLKDNRKIELINMIYTDMEDDLTMTYNAVYLSKLLLKKIIKKPGIKFPDFIDSPDCSIYRKIILKILCSSSVDMLVIRKLAAETIRQLGNIVHSDEFGIVQDPTVGIPKLQSNIKITAYQANRGVIDRRMSKLRQTLAAFVDLLSKLCRDSSFFSPIVYFIIKDFLSISSSVFDINYKNFDNLNSNAIETIHTVLKIVFEPLFLALDSPDQFYIIKDVQFLNTQLNFQSLAQTVAKYFNGTELGGPGERWLNEINEYLRLEEHLILKKTLVEKILNIKGDLESEYLEALFNRSLDPFDKEVTVSCSSLILLHSTTEKYLEKLIVNNPSYDPLVLLTKKLAPVPKSSVFVKGELLNLRIFNRSLRQDQSIVRCNYCNMLVCRDLAPSHFAPVLKLYESMPPRSSEAILTNILSMGPRKNKKGKFFEYIDQYLENYSVYLRDLTVHNTVKDLITDINTIICTKIEVSLEDSDLLQNEKMELEKEKIAVAIAEKCAIEYHRRQSHAKTQVSVSKSFDRLWTLLMSRIKESILDDSQKENLLFNLEYGSSNLELEQFSDSVMFSIYLNKLREYTNKKEMSISLFANIKNDMKRDLRGFMKRSLKDLIKKKIVTNFVLSKSYNIKNINFSFEVDNGSFIIIIANSPSKLNLCGRDEFREEEILFYDKFSDKKLTLLREECKAKDEDFKITIENEGTIKVDFSVINLIILIGEIEDKLSAYIQNIKLSERNFSSKPSMAEEKDLLDNQLDTS